MDTYITAYPSYSLGRWLVALAISLLLLAIAYTRAPDPAWQLGLDTTSPRSLANSHPAPAQRSYRLVPQAPALATQLGQRARMASRAPFAQKVLARLTAH